ncbi:alpha-1,2-fucosyltransferase [Microbacter sp. GSS18]|nr:alpha-1,2-fucosyltransferase [Microbacter sp. GSS18]
MTRGTVILPFGRQFAGKTDFLTREGYKGLRPIDGISPFTALGAADPTLAPLATSARTSPRAALDVRKSLSQTLADSGADVMVVDNTPALLRLRRHGDQLYTLIPGEKTDLMDMLWNDDEAEARTRSVSVTETGLDPELRAAYLAFADACVEQFGQDRIVLVRSHVPRFSVADDGTIGLATGRWREARLLDELDHLFASHVGCRVSDAATTVFPTGPAWQSFGVAARRPIEDDLIRIIEDPAGQAPARDLPPPRTEPSAADLIADAVRDGVPMPVRRIGTRLRTNPATPHDAVALAYLAQAGEISPRTLARLVRRAVRDPRSPAVQRTRAQWSESAGALRLQLGGADPRPRSLRPQIALACRPEVTLRLLSDGAVRVLRSEEPTEQDARDLAASHSPVSLRELPGVLRSWPYYLERGRRGVTAAVCVEVSGAAELADSCAWLPWRTILQEENVTFAVGRRAASEPDRVQDVTARTDLRFLFDPQSRIGTVGGGLMDQITHVALYETACAPIGAQAYYDDFRYTWWRAHNGFEADRLAPEVGDRRITRRISLSLTERFRAEVDSRPYLPWVYSQSRAWHSLGLRDAVFVARDDPNSRRLREQPVEFALHVYSDLESFHDLVERPPGAVTIFTTQDRMPIDEPSADKIRSVFRFDTLLEHETPPAGVAAMAERLQSSRYIALHVRRGDFLHDHFDVDGWHGTSGHYATAIDTILREADEDGTSESVNVAVFSDDLAHVANNTSEFGLDKISGDVVFVAGNSNYDSIWDSYLMSLCPVVIGSVGSFAATTSLLADAPSTFIRSTPGGVEVLWQRT